MILVSFWGRRIQKLRFQNSEMKPAVAAAAAEQQQRAVYRARTALTGMADMTGMTDSLSLSKNPKVGEKNKYTRVTLS